MPGSEVFKHRALANPPESEDDQPVDGFQVPKVDGPFDLPALVFGCGVFSTQYNSDDHLLSQEGTKAVRLALRYGICAFDTSRYYGPSEYVLGNILLALKDEFPRSSYQIMTKCGRFGLNDFDYSPSTIRQCVLESLERLQTTYLDAVYLHDVEFVATVVSPKATGNHTTALGVEATAYGLASGDEAKVWGEGDQKILDAFAELRKLKQEGVIKNIGITGYPLATLLRLAILINSTPPYEPVDVLLSYSHLTLQDSTFNVFAPHFYERAKVKHLLAASPLSMGLLAPRPPLWHPAPGALKSVIVETLSTKVDLPNLALGYTARQTGTKTPLVGGFSNVKEVHECVRVWREVYEGNENEARVRQEKDVISVFQKLGYLDWSWSSP
ncbi:Aldo/keto reductase [Macrolepiota fuliginosa MF-IS2]|uniref:Aldo/keto reductase n=1 Tax=Macrolepiota fuliginosa MF-IS2 TaxID=1400762 RepID=A0A9P5XLP4_9AGAR|nr:Aldo/keto reductase [Macrolepiota fuliginosa MF-IS2]